jgi:hypothetical protein
VDWSASQIARACDGGRGARGEWGGVGQSASPIARACDLCSRTCDACGVMPVCQPHLLISAAQSRRSEPPATLFVNVPTQSQPHLTVSMCSLAAGSGTPTSISRSNLRGTSDRSRRNSSSGSNRPSCTTPLRTTAFYPSNMIWTIGCSTASKLVLLSPHAPLPLSPPPQKSCPLPPPPPQCKHPPNAPTLRTHTHLHTLLHPPPMHCSVTTGHDIVVCLSSRMMLVSMHASKYSLCRHTPPPPHLKQAQSFNYTAHKVAHSTTR